MVTVYAEFDRTASTTSDRQPCAIFKVARRSLSSSGYGEAMLSVENVIKRHCVPTLSSVQPWLRSRSDSAGERLMSKEGAWRLQCTPTMHLQRRRADEVRPLVDTIFFGFLVITMTSENGLRVGKSYASPFLKAIVNFRPAPPPVEATGSGSRNH